MNLFIIEPLNILFIKFNSMVLSRKKIFWFHCMFYLHWCKIMDLFVLFIQCNSNHNKEMGPFLPLSSTTFLQLNIYIDMWNPKFNLKIKSDIAYVFIWTTELRHVVGRLSIVSKCPCCNHCLAIVTKSFTYYFGTHYFWKSWF